MRKGSPSEGQEALVTATGVSGDRDEAEEFPSNFLIFFCEKSDKHLG